MITFYKGEYCKSFLECVRKGMHPLFTTKVMKSDKNKGKKYNLLVPDDRKTLTQIFYCAAMNFA